MNRPPVYFTRDQLAQHAGIRPIIVQHLLEQGKIHIDGVIVHGRRVQELFREDQLRAAWMNAPRQHRKRQTAPFAPQTSAAASPASVHPEAA